MSGVVIVILVMCLAGRLLKDKEKQSINVEEQIVRPLEKYMIKNLAARDYDSKLEWDEVTATTTFFRVQKFHFASDGKLVSGLAHIPNKCDVQQKCPIILQLRGYAERDKYVPGYGTWRSAEEYAKAGMISLAPDFLGYGQSASPSADVFEARFETYTTVLNLLGGVNKWEYNNGNVGLWGHSNGGHIALVILEITGKNLPTVLWAPVSAGFPYSILFYMNENEPGDKLLRRKLAEFEEKYESTEFNLLNFLERINARVQLHQGKKDLSVPAEWNRDLVSKMKELKKDIVYFEYSEADHNLIPDWETVVNRDISFFKENLKLTE